MYDLSVLFYSMSTIAQAGTFMLLSLVSGALFGFLFKLDFRIRRMTFFVISSMLICLGPLLNMSFTSVAIQSDRNIAGTAFLAIIVSGVILAAITWIFAAARSRDIKGSSELAVLAFIPLAVLYLYFARGKASVDRSEKRSKFARYVLDPVIAITMIVLMLITFAILDNNRSAIQIGPVMAADIAKRHGPEKTARNLADSERAIVGTRVGDNVTLAAISERDGTIQYTYKLEGLAPTSFEGAKASLAEIACTPGTQRALLDMGGAFIFTYQDEAGAHLFEQRIVKDDCPA